MTSQYRSDRVACVVSELGLFINWANEVLFYWSFRGTTPLGLTNSRVNKTNINAACIMYYVALTS